MKQALILIDEMNVKIDAYNKTKSPKLKRDLEKSLYKDFSSLRKYCKYKQLNYFELIKKVHNIY